MLKCSCFQTFWWKSLTHCFPNVWTQLPSTVVSDSSFENNLELNWFNEPVVKKNKSKTLSVGLKSPNPLCKYNQPEVSFSPKHNVTANNETMSFFYVSKLKLRVKQITLVFPTCQHVLFSWSVNRVSCTVIIGWVNWGFFLRRRSFTHFPESSYSIMFCTNNALRFWAMQRCHHGAYLSLRSIRAKLIDVLWAPLFFTFSLRFYQPKLKQF